jgi:hypothetical protein
MENALKLFDRTSNVLHECCWFLVGIGYMQVAFVSPCCKWVPVTTACRVLRLRMEERPPTWRVAANILNKQSRITDKGWSFSLGVGRGASNSSLWKRILVTKYVFTNKPSDSTDTVVRPKQRKRDMKFCTWNVRSLYRAGSHTAASRELAGYKLDLVRVQEVR